MKKITLPVALRACALLAFAVSPFSLAYSPYATGLLLLLAGFLVQIAEKVATQPTEVNHV